jgi:hypothetical protein
MQKLDTLRAAITAVLPDLARDPSRLRVWIERGTIRCRQTATHAFSFEFQAQVLLVEIPSDHVPVVAVAVFQWARVNQPDLLAFASPGIAFDADILDSGAADVLLQLDLIQNVSAAPAQGGGLALSWLAEPDPLILEEPTWLPPPPPSFLETDGPPPVFYTHDEVAGDETANPAG